MTAKIPFVVTSALDTDKYDAQIPVRLKPGYVNSGHPNSHDTPGSTPIDVPASLGNWCDRIPVVDLLDNNTNKEDLVAQASITSDRPTQIKLTGSDLGAKRGTVFLALPETPDDALVGSWTSEDDELTRRSAGGGKLSKPGMTVMSWTDDGIQFGLQDGTDQSLKPGNYLLKVRTEGNKETVGRFVLRINSPSCVGSLGNQVVGHLDPGHRKLGERDLDPNARAPEVALGAKPAELPPVTDWWELKAKDVDFQYRTDIWTYLDGARAEGPVDSYRAKGRSIPLIACKDDVIQIIVVEVPPDRQFQTQNPHNLTVLGGGATSPAMYELRLAFDDGTVVKPTLSVLGRPGWLEPFDIGGGPVLYTATPPQTSSRIVKVEMDYGWSVSGTTLPPGPHGATMSSHNPKQQTLVWGQE